MISCEVNLSRAADQDLQSINSHNANQITPDSHIAQSPSCKRSGQVLHCYHRKLCFTYLPVDSLALFRCWQSSILSGVEGRDVLAEQASMLLNVA